MYSAIIPILYLVLTDIEKCAILYTETNEREDLTIKAEDFFKILDDLKTNGEAYDGNVYYWISTRYEKDGEEYKAIEQIVADIPHEDKKYTEQITFDVKEL